MTSFRSLAAVGLGLCLLTPVGAEVVIRDIVINQSAPTPENTNIRVNLHNTGRRLERPSHVELQVRSDDGAGWQTIKTWKNHLTLLAGKRLSLDYLPAMGTQLHPSLQQPNFQVRAVVHGLSTDVAMLEESHTRALP